jgi:peptide/nickel transport system substrate-binding protein
MKMIELPSRLIYILSLCLLISLLTISCSSSQPSTTSAPVPATTTAAATSSVAPTQVKPSAATTAALTSAPIQTQAPTTTVASSAKYGGTLKIIDLFIPAQPIGAPWESPLSVPSMQAGLYKILGQKATGELAPELAASWDIDDSQQSPSITFHLRKGVKFHDGTDFNAQAVKWNLEKFKSGGLFANTSYQKSFEVIDDSTIRVNFTEWRNAFPPSFAGIQGYMVSPAAFDKNGIDWVRWHIVGAGPFKQKDFQRDVSLTYTRFENYWDTGKPYLDGMQFIYVADMLTRTVLYRSGGGDVMNVDAKTASEFQAAGNKVVSIPNATLALFPDSANPDSPWANIKVRQAAEYALDKEAITRAFGFGFYKAAYQLPSTSSSANVPTITGRKYDVAKAKQLLTEAGFPSGFKSRLIAPSSTSRDLMAIMQSYLGAVGIKVEIELPEAAKFSSYMGGTWDNALIVGSVVEIANYNLTFNNFINYPVTMYKSAKRPDTWPDLYKTTLTSKDVDPKLQQKAVQALYDDLTAIPLYHTQSLWVINDKLKDSGIGNKILYWDTENAWLSK